MGLGFDGLKTADNGLGTSAVFLLIAEATTGTVVAAIRDAPPRVWAPSPSAGRQAGPRPAAGAAAR